MSKLISSLEKFIKFEATSGILLLIAAFAAIIMVNSGFSFAYSDFINSYLKLQIGDHLFKTSVEHFVNDGLMAVFFLLVSLEIKKEILEGHLSTPSQRTLPIIAAIAGVVVPAFIFVIVNNNNSLHGALALNGWAIPTATDIAFALGVLALFGKRVPVALKVFLMALAIIDDLIAILIIAIFYNDSLSLLALLSSLAVIFALGMMNVAGVQKKSAYLTAGFLLWCFVINSGIHATIAGVILGLFIPLNKGKNENSPLNTLMHDLHYIVGFFIVPLFAFVNSGISLKGVSLATLMQDSIALGIMLGLFAGKQVGVLISILLAVSLKIAKMPNKCNWGQIYGVSLLTGIGFTMSIFVGNLAYPGSPEMIQSAKMGIIFGSGFSALLGYFVLSLTCPNPNKVSSDLNLDLIAEQDGIDISSLTKMQKKAYKDALNAEKKAAKKREQIEAKARKNMEKADAKLNPKMEKEKAKLQTKVRAKKNKIESSTAKHEQKAAERIQKAKTLAKQAEEIKSKFANVNDKSKPGRKKTVKKSVVSKQIHLVKSYTENKRANNLEKKANAHIAEAEKILANAKRIKDNKTELLAKKIAKFEDKINKNLKKKQG